MLALLCGAAFGASIAAAECGNGTCEPEDCELCAAADNCTMEECGTCGDGTCDADLGETEANCDDCDPCADGTCNLDEDCGCADGGDCGAYTCYGTCGDGRCSDSETTATCCEDCYTGSNKEQFCCSQDACGGAECCYTGGNEYLCSELNYEPEGGINCCADGADNDNDAAIDQNDEDCGGGGYYGCLDECADEYDDEATDHDQSLCAYSSAGGAENSRRGGSACCADGRDNDINGYADNGIDVNGDGTIDMQGDAACDGLGGPTCQYSFSYQVSVACASSVTGSGQSGQTAFGGQIQANLASPCPSASDVGAAAQIAVTSELVATGRMCGMYSAANNGAFVGDHYFFSLLARDTCLNISGNQETVPAGFTQSSDLVCLPAACVEGDSDDDGICDLADPCDVLADADLGDGLCGGVACAPQAEAAAAGLIVEADGTCDCGQFVRNLDVGDSGEDVGALQDRLSSLGYLAEGAFSRGTFGPSTRAALASYQDARPGLETAGVFGNLTRADFNSDAGVVTNGADYDVAANLCGIVVTPDDLCPNLCGDSENNDCDEDAAWLAAHPELERVADGQGSWGCVCADDDAAVDCPNNHPGTLCLADSDGCCDPVNNWRCPTANPSACIPNRQSCGGGCRDGYTYCASSGRCVSNPRECVEGCFEYGSPAGEYCTEIVGADGAVNEPWATRFEGDAAGLAAFFAERNEAGAQTFGEATTSQAAAIAARAASTGGSAVPVYPIYGRVPVVDDNGQCDANVCDYGQECALFVRPGGATSAVCVDAVDCDPCDESLPSEPANGPVPGECYYDEDLCPCDPETDPGRCCDYDPDILGEANVSGCLLTPSSLTIEVVPSFIDPSDDQNDSCFVLWAARGMASTTLVGDGVPAWARHLRAGVVEVDGVEASTVYKLLGRGVDGREYQAADLCAVNPVIREV